MTKLSRRNFLRTSTVSALALLFTAKFKSKAFAQASGEVKWWTVTGGEIRDQGVADALVARFAELSPNLTVNATFLPDDGYSERLNTAFGTGAGLPDAAFIWDPNWYPATLDLTEKASADGFDLGQYLPYYIDVLCRDSDDRLVGLPLGLGSNMFFYNKTLFEQNGVPLPEWGWTMQQYYDAAVAIADPENRIYGAAWPAGWGIETYAFGARPLAEDGVTAEGHLNGPATVAALEYWYDFARSGAMPTAAEMASLATEGGGPIDLFSTGRLGIAHLNNLQFNQVREAGIDFGVIHEPQVEGQPIVRNGWTLVTGVPAAAENPDGGWEFLKFLCGEEGQRILMNAEGSTYIPTITSLLEEVPNSDDPNLQFFFRYLQESYLIQDYSSQWTYTNEVLRQTNDLFEEIYLGTIERGDIKSRLDALVPEVESLVEERREELGLD